MNPEDVPGSFYATADEGALIIAEADRTNIEPMFYRCHVGRTGADVIAILECLVPVIDHVQVVAGPSRAGPDAGPRRSTAALAVDLAAEASC